MMDDNLCIYYCQSCGEAIHSHRYDGGYGDHSYAHLTIKPYEEKRFNLPEQQYSMTLKICLDCINKDPTCHKVVTKKRLEWFDDNIDRKEKFAINREEEANRILKEEIPKLKKEIKELKKKKQEVIDSEK